MAGSGCSCAMGAKMTQVPSLPTEFREGRTLTVWETMSFNQGTPESSEAFPVPPCNAVALEFTVINYTVSPQASGKIQTCMDRERENFVDAGTFNIAADGTTFVVVTAVSGMYFRIQLLAQSGVIVCYAIVHVPCR